MTDKRIKMECPFCHTPPEKIQIKSVGKYWLISCPLCGATFPMERNKQMIIDRWNRR